MRTDDEIIARIKSLESEDFFRFETLDLLKCLAFGVVRPFLKPDATAEVWGDPLPRDRDSVLKRMHDYMDFAWDKANSFRGLSASRSISHFRSWIWLLGDDFPEVEYEHYGKEILAAICEKYGWDVTQWDDGVRLNNEP
ncbi:MAG: hypothetical protein ACYDBH_24700 [Acidobacteriaceae bacterium]